MQNQSPVGIWQNVVDVEQESVKAVFEKRPDEVAEEEAWHKLGERCRGEGVDNSYWVGYPLQQQLAGD
jgi:hypothetical protein